jgi:hypothetical protein
MSGNAGAFAAKLRLNAMAGIALVGAVFFGLPVFVDFQKPPGLPLWAGLVIAATAVLALSHYLLFDAMLFRLLASHENETAGGMAVDHFLSRAGLRKMPESNRSVDERMGGASRLLNFQRAALLVFLAVFVSMAAG